MIQEWREVERGKIWEGIDSSSVEYEAEKLEKWRISIDPRMMESGHFDFMIYFCYYFGTV